MKTAVSALALSFALPVFAADQPPATLEPAAAIVGGAPIPARLVEERVKDQLFQIKANEFDLRMRALNAIIDEQLMRSEAAARKATLEVLFKNEVDAKAKAVTPEQVQAAFEEQKARFKDKPEAEAKAQLEGELRRERLAERRAAFMRELRGRAGVEVLIEPPRLVVDTGTAPVRGPQDAPVTIVEFSDFECPYCIRVAPTLEKVREAYADKIRIAFRDFPLPFHPLAAKAAEAAACAGSQGRFWEMHDKLFAVKGKLQVVELKAYATDLGLDGEAFGACLDSGKLAADWKADLQAGQRYGVTGTPAFFINGRRFVGAQAYEDFAAVIDDELSRAALKPAPGTAKR